MLETAKRFPGQELSKEALSAITEDWDVCAKDLGISRFTDAVKRCWQYCEYFPKPINIRELAPAPRLTDGERWLIELKDLQRRKAAGEKFYTLGDVFEAVAKKIQAGEIKPSNPSWFEWAKKLNPKRKENPIR